MNQLRKRGAAVGLCAALLCMVLPPSFAAEESGIMPMSVANSEIVSVEFTAGRLDKAFSAYTVDYTLSLGPDDESFSLLAAPFEDDPRYAPTIELTVDGGAAQALTPGEYSEEITVGTGEYRTVTLASTAKDPNQAATPTREYTFGVYRTASRFTWEAQAPQALANGGTLLPVRLQMPEGLRMKALLLTLAFDPAQLQLCDAAGNVLDAAQTSTTTNTSLAWRCVADPSDTLFYDSGHKNNFFTITASQLNNEAGIAHLELGKETAGKSDAHTVTADNADALTLYFTLQTDAPDGSALSAEDLTVLEYCAPQDMFITVSAAGMAQTDLRALVDETASAVRELLGVDAILNGDRTAATVSDGQGAVSLRLVNGGGLDRLAPDVELELTASPEPGYRFQGWQTGRAGRSIAAEPLAEENPYRIPYQPDLTVRAVYEAKPDADAPRLLAMELQGLTGARYPVWQDGDTPNFLFQPNETAYRVYLLPGEAEFGLRLLSYDSVSAVTVNGVPLQAAATDGEALLWTEPDGALTLAASDNGGRFRIELTDAAGKTTAYELAAETLDKAPQMLVSKNGATATVKNAAFRTVSLALRVQGNTETAAQLTARAEASLAGTGLQVSKLTLADDADGWQTLRLTLDTAGAAVYEAPLSFALLNGMGTTVEIYDEAITDNVIGDARLGALSCTTALAAGYEMRCTVRAQGAQTMYATVYGQAGDGYAETGTRYALTAPADGSDIWTFAELLEDGTYKLVFTMEHHVPLTVEGVTVSGAAAELANVLYLPYGDLNEDGVTGLADRNLLVAALFQNGSNTGYDLDGDSKTTLADLNLLMQEVNYNKRPQTVAAEMKGA